jgi:LysR family transcriptional activator of nhaA
MQWLNYHHLFYFWTVAKSQSFTKAALELRIAQSAVSLQVAQLEEFLGKKLINRSTSKKIALTEEGQIVFRQAEEIFRQGKELVDSVKEDGLSAAIRFGALGSLSKNLQVQLLRPILASDRYELSVDIGDPSTLLARLKGFHLDAILCDVPYPHSEDEPLIQRQIAREHFCWVSRKSKDALLLPPKLEHHGIYLPAKSNPATAEIENHLKNLKSKVKIKGYIDDIALLRLLALETDSIVAIPKIGAERELREKKLVVLHEYRSLFQKFYVVLRQNSPRTGKILKLLGQD